MGKLSRMTLRKAEVHELQDDCLPLELIGKDGRRVILSIPIEEVREFTTFMVETSISLSNAINLHQSRTNRPDPAEPEPLTLDPPPRIASEVGVVPDPSGGLSLRFVYRDGDRTLTMLSAPLADLLRDALNQQMPWDPGAGHIQ